MIISLFQQNNNEPVVLTMRIYNSYYIQSMTGRIVMSSYETLRAAGTNVVCLSPVSVWMSAYMFARFTYEIAMRTVSVSITIR